MHEILSHLVVSTQRKAVVTTHKVYRHKQANSWNGEHTRITAVLVRTHTGPPFYRLPPCMTPFSPLLGCAAESHTCCACVLCLLLCLTLWLCGSLCTSVPRLSSPHRMSEPPTYVCVLSSTPIGWPPGITLRHLYELAVYGFYRFVVVSWPSHHFLALSDDNRR